MDMENKASDYIREDNTEKNINEMPGIKKLNFFDILKTETGQGDIEIYKNHPLNFNKSDSISQILRGATGFFGKLNLAIIDILLGIFQTIIEKRSIKENV